MEHIKEKTKSVVKPWHSTKNQKEHSDLLVRWKTLAGKIGAVWDGGNAADEITKQRTKNLISRKPMLSSAASNNTFSRVSAHS